MSLNAPQASSSLMAMGGDSRPQASPLPIKRGEIGYDEEVHGPAMAEIDREIAASRPSATMGARHPADHSPDPMSAGDVRTPAAEPPQSATARATRRAAPASASSASLPTMKKPRKPLPKFGGVTLTTLLKVITQLLILAGTGVGWAFAIMALRRNEVRNEDTPGSPSFGSTSTTVYIHVAFGIVTIAELVFLERGIFRIRAERYAYRHPGEMLNSSRGRYLEPSMPMAPWQRPSLPTYAAALAQSGARTGDVEDLLIAQPPPPAYGKTRGSTLLLQGFFTAEHSRRARVYDEEAHLNENGEPLEVIRSGADSMVSSERPSRPASYHSHDSEWEVRRDMERAQAVEQALAAMEGVPQAHISDRDRP